jgi:hypothetical protein
MKQDPCDFGVNNLVQMHRGTKILIGFRVEIDYKWWCNGYCPGEGVDSCPEGFNGFNSKKWFITAIDDLDITNKEFNKLQDLGRRAWKARKAVPVQQIDWTSEEWNWFKDFIKAECSSIKLVMEKQLSDHEKDIVEALTLSGWCNCDEDEGRRQKFTFMLDDYLSETPSKRAFSR